MKTVLLTGRRRICINGVFDVALKHINLQRYEESI